MVILTRLLCNIYGKTTDVISFEKTEFYGEKKNSQTSISLKCLENFSTKHSRSCLTLNFTFLKNVPVVVFPFKISHALM